MTADYKQAFKRTLEFVIFMKTELKDQREKYHEELDTEPYFLNGAIDAYESVFNRMYDFLEESTADDIGEGEE